MIKNLIKFIVLGVTLFAFSGCEAWDYGEHPQITAIKKISEYADSNDTNTAPDAKLYKSAGISIDGSDINTTNTYIQTLSSNDVNTTEKIQEIVDNIDDLTAAPNEKPVAKINVHSSSVVEGEKVLLDAIESTDSDGDIVKYEWKKKDTLLGRGISHDAELTVGRHIITLVVTDDDDDTDKAYISVIVTKVEETNSSVTQNSKPIAKINVTGNNTLSITLDASSSSDSDGKISKYLWEEGNTELSTARVYKVTGLRVGKHTISLTVTDDKGDIGTTTETIEIKDSNSSNTTTEDDNTTTEDDNTTTEDDNTSV